MSGAVSGSFSSSTIVSQVVSSHRQVVATMLNPTAGNQQVITLLFPNNIALDNEFAVSLTNQILVSNIESGSIPIAYTMDTGAIKITEVTDSTFSGTFSGMTREIQGQDGYLKVSNGTFSIKK